MISYAHLNSKEVFCANLVWLLHLAGYQKNWTWFLVLSVAVWFADWNLYNIKANFLQPLSVLKISFFFKQAYFRQYVMDTLESWYWPHLGCSGSPFINSMTGAELIDHFEHLEYNNHHCLWLITQSIMCRHIWIIKKNPNF